jgi:hypothetical protein
MTSILKPSRPVALFLASAVAVTSSVVLLNAATTLTVPNAATVSYALGAGGNSAAIFPAANVPVHVMGVQTAVGFRGVGQVTLLRPSVAPLFIEWTGIESPAGAAITSGFSDVPGTHIVYLDFSHQVDIEVNGATSIRVHNGSGAVRTGNVTLIW